MVAPKLDRPDLETAPRSALVDWIESLEYSLTMLMPLIDISQLDLARGFKNGKG